MTKAQALCEQQSADAVKTPGLLVLAQALKEDLWKPPSYVKWPNPPVAMI